MTPFPWLEVVDRALKKWDTPFYLLAWSPVVSALEEMRPLEAIGLPVRHWLSVKSQPVNALLHAWLRLGYGAEVVSEFELMAARKAGFPADSICVNGTAKHSWLPRQFDTDGLRVHIDSLTEIESLGGKTLSKYRLGVRCHPRKEYDPDDRTFGGQFGMDPDEFTRAVERLRSNGLSVEGLHFHLRSNVRDVNDYCEAMEEILGHSRSIGVQPTYIDCGGGFPSPGESILEGNDYVEHHLDLGRLGASLRHILEEFPSIREVWFENGKFVTGRSGVLVLRVTDIKERSESRYLICDGGRTNHALVSDWQQHDIRFVPTRTGAPVLTTVCGPTCMAYDRLTRRPLPCDIAIGDHVIWFNAGAYHLPWETRFSHGLAKVLWCDEQGEISLIRRQETFLNWWGLWDGKE